jgi:hypothetical protein
VRNAARRSGVGTLYDKSLKAISRHFASRSTTKDGLSFLDSAGKTVFYLLPKESSSETGLRYTVYVKRFAAHLRVNVGRAKEILPGYKSLDEARRGIGEFGGGYLKDESDVERFSGELEKARFSVSPDEHA